MRKIITTVTTVLTIFALYAQTAPPKAFNYSGVARNANNTPIATQNIGVQFSILKSNPTTGAVVYSENHFTATDAFGLFNLSIGTGAVQSGNFANIDWSNDNYFLRVGIDPTGGTNFAIIGATQFLSVPYALYAKSAGSVSGGSISNNDFVLKLNGKIISDSTLNLVFTGLSGQFLTSTNYWIDLERGINSASSMSSMGGYRYTTDTVSNSNVYLITTNLDFYRGFITAVNFPITSGLYYVPLTATVTTVSNLYRYDSFLGYVKYMGGTPQQVIQLIPNNPTITKLSEPLPYNLTSERQ